MKYLHKQLWDYAEKDGLLPKLKVQKRDDENSAPVFACQHAAKNILIRPDADAETRAKVFGDILLDRWVCHMNSSRVLTQSVFANLIASGDLRVLNDLATDQGLPAFDIDLNDAEAHLEYKVTHLRETTPSSIDVFIRGARRIAVECKLTESEFGECSMPKKKKCNGDYVRQQGRKTRCALSEKKIAYWQHAPKLFHWSSDHDHRPCPMNFTYQIARNLLAACVAEDGTVDTDSSHALIIYDARNPAFHDGGKCRKQFDAACKALKIPETLRSCNWQSVVALLAKNASTKWLAAQLQNKYDF